MAVPGAISAVLEVAKVGIHKDVQALSIQVTVIEELMKTAEGIQQEWNDDEYY